MQSSKYRITLPCRILYGSIRVRLDVAAYVLTVAVLVALYFIVLLGI